MGEGVWNTLVTISEVYDREKDECISQINKVNWKSDTLYSAIISFQCNNCGSGLITIEDPKPEPDYNNFICRSCNNIIDYETIAEEALKEYFAGQWYGVYANGAEPDLIQCPFCNNDTYIYHEEQCALCGESAEHTCQRCGSNIPPEEISEESYCDWCLHMMSKDD